MRPVRIVIFAKAPLPGLAKSRLIPCLGPEGAAALAERLLRYTLAQAFAAAVGPVELCVTPTLNHAVWKGLDLPNCLELSEQGEGGLGARLARAAQRAAGDGNSVLLAGTDCPQLTGDRFRLAAAALSGHDASLVPVHDGGYALLGLNRYHPSLFAGIPWSTAVVAKLTRRRLAALGWSTKEFPLLHDIDEPGDLQWLPEALALNPGQPLATTATNAKRPATAAAPTATGTVTAPHPGR